MEEWRHSSLSLNSVILKLVNLLLMEKSLLVAGQHPAIVSMVATGVKNLYFLQVGGSLRAPGAKQCP